MYNPIRTFPSNVTLSSSQGRDASFNTTFSPNTITIPTNGTSSAIMTLTDAWGHTWDQASTPHFLKVNAIITLPDREVLHLLNRLPNGTAPVITPSKALIEHSDLVITELNLSCYIFDIWNRFNPILNSIIPIATAIIGFLGRDLIGRFWKKSQKNDQDKKKFDQGWSTT
jgi:hypothetical protein